MNNREVLAAFFAAENRRDWQACRGFLHEDVVWVLHARETVRIAGIDSCMQTIMAAYRDNDNTFTCEALYGSGDASRIVAMLVNCLGARSCDIFEVSDGKIRAEYEFLL